MKKILAIMLVLGLMLALEASAVSATRYYRHGYNANYPAVALQNPVINARVGPVGSPLISSYFLGLRGGRVTHQLQDYNQRVKIASAFYPQESITGPVGWRTYTRKPRYGGQYANSLAGFRGITFGDFVFTGQ